MKRLTVALFIAISCVNFSEAGGQKNIQSQLEPEVNVLAVSVSSAEVISEMEEIIAKSYYRQDVDARAFAEELFSGGASIDDPHSEYLSPIERGEIENQIRGVVYGIGVQLDISAVDDKNPAKRFLSVKEVVKNSPAEKAGLQSGDYIVAVASDGVKGHSILLKERDFGEVIWLIRGDRGAPVYLRVLRKEKLLEFVIIRDEVRQKMVFGRFVKPGIGYIHLTEFGGDDTLNDFSILVSSLQEHGMRALIWDLRNNPGGYLSYAIIMSKWFQDSKDSGSVVVLKIRGRTFLDFDDKVLNVLSRFGQGKYRNIPLVVLVNEYSASASELVAVFLKDYCGISLIGKRTHGKGTVQTIIPLKNGGALKLTVAEYFVGEKEIPVDKIGVGPTIGVENPKKVRSEKEDDQLQRAIQEAEKIAK